MKRLFLAVLVLASAAPLGAEVFERFLSPRRPADRAIMAYHELAKSGKATSNDLANLGVLLYQKGFPEDAATYLKKALKLDKENAEAAYRLGLVEQRMGNYSRAIRAYTKAIDVRPGHAYARFMLGLAEERRGNRDRAIFHYAKAYRHAPELADPRVNPLVIDSKLQAEAQILRYERDVAAVTLDVELVDRLEVRRMMAARPGAPPEPEEEPTPAPEPTPTPAPRVLTPAPAPPAEPAAPSDSAPAANAPEPAPEAAPQAGPTPSLATPSTAPRPPRRVTRTTGPGESNTARPTPTPPSD